MYGGAAMNYGGMRGSGMGGGPMPQRQGGNNRRNNRGNFGRPTRFDQNQQQNFNQQNRPPVNQQNASNPPNQNSRPSDEVHPEPAATVNNAVKQETKPATVPTPTQQTPTQKPQQSPVQTPVVQAQPAPQPQQQQNQQRQQQQNQQRQQQPQQQNQQQRPQQTPPATQQRTQQQVQQNQQQRPQQPQQQRQQPPQLQQNQQRQQPPQQQQLQQQQQQQQPQQQLQALPAQQSQQQSVVQAQQSSVNADIIEANPIQTVNSMQHQGQQNQHYNQNRPQNHYNNRQGGGGGGMQKGGMGGGGFKRQLQDNKGAFGGGSGAGGNREEHAIVQKLREIGGPTLDLPPLEQDELRFSGRSRLYIGNLTNDITEQEVLDMFTPYGETAELFVNKEKNFAFIRIDYRTNAEKARRELDGNMRKGRALRVRFAPHNSAIKVCNLTAQVSNELLYRSFEVFGKIERALIKVDDRGKSLCEGVVEYARKASAVTAIRYCTERCYFITSSLRPVIVEPFDEIDDLDGYPEKTLPKKHPDFIRSREVGPRFADINSFEHEYGTRWKQLHELYRQKEEALKAELADERDKLEAQMELARYEQETEMLREALRRREAERERATMNWRAAGERREADRATDRANVLRTQDDISQRMRLQDDEIRRRQQENTLFMQAQQLNSMLDQQEQGLGGGGYDAADTKRGFDQGLPSAVGLDSGYLDHGRQFGSADRAFEGDMMARWRHDDFPNKRRRY